MAYDSLSGRAPKDTFGDLIRVQNAGVGLDTTTQKQITDGNGKTLPMTISGQAVSLDNVSKYKMAALDTTGAINLALGNVFRISASTNRTITFSNVPGASTAMTVIIVVSGSTGTFTWPGGILWSGGAIPTFGTNKTIITLLWDGTSWIGSTSIKA